MSEIGGANTVNVLGVLCRVRGAPEMNEQEEHSLHSDAVRLVLSCLSCPAPCLALSLSRAVSCPVLSCPVSGLPGFRIID